MIPRTIPLPKRGQSLPKFPGNLPFLGKGIGDARRSGGAPKSLKKVLIGLGVLFALFILVALTMGVAPTPVTVTEPLTLGQGA